MGIYDYSVKDIQGNDVSMEEFKGKVLLIVNTATGCGFTPQYDGLEALYAKYKDKGFEILDFPCNQFAGQAPGTNEEIVSFCKMKFGVSFRQFAKIKVNGKEADPLYVYLKSHTELDFDYIRRELEKLKIEKFERKCRELSLKLFGFQPLSGEECELLPEFLYSSLYGSVAQGEYNGLTRSLDGKDTKGAKTKYLLDRTFISGKALEKQYPFFARHKLLLPALYIYRPVKGIIKRPKYILREVKKVIKYKSPKNRL
jgi:glutathione peroxidase